MNRRCGLKFCSLCFFGMIGFLTWPGGLNAENFADRLRAPVRETVSIRKETQASLDQWGLEKEQLAAEYDALKKQVESRKLAQENLKNEISLHESRVALLDKEVADASRISAEIQPFLKEVHGRLNQLVRDGLPFLVRERADRLHNLQTVLKDPGIAVSEKFRKLLEAVQIEAEYGNTVEVYPRKIVVDGKEFRADIFRLGRISLFFQSIDRETAGYFDAGSGLWEVLPEKYNRDIGSVIEIGSKRRPVELVNLPLGRISIR